MATNSHADAMIVDVPYSSICSPDVRCQMLLVPPSLPAGDPGGLVAHENTTSAPCAAGVAAKASTLMPLPSRPWS